MSKRTTLALLGVLAVLAATALFVQGPGRFDRPRTRAALFPGLIAGDVVRIRVTGSTANVLLSREGGAWKLGAAKEPADGAAVEALLADLTALREGAVVSTNAARQAAYETEAGKGIAVRLEGIAGKVLAAFVVGKHGPDHASCYLRRDGASEVLLIERDLRTEFSRPLENWRAPLKEQ